ncbi:MAG: InlB B-repeat-containing protein [Kiritimatiellae bacterium]|nr:InlB B-repeat-containing protein [Kiritimatiellia bacterium]
MNNAASSLTIDNLKIWNYAKTDFSDRFDEDAGVQNDPLLLWNRLGSADQVSTSEVGPNAALANGTFVPGPFGNAVELSVPNQPAVTLPVELMSQESGCIEFWAKMNVTPSSLTWGSSVILAAYLEPSANGFSTYPFIHFNGNDGAANGGLCARLGGIGSAGTAPFSAGGWTYSSALKGADPAEWHHYAMVWSTQEIASLGTPTRRLAIFVDGALNTGSWGGPVLPPYVSDYADGGLLGLLYMSSGTTGNIAIDNVKIWNYAKTDFSDRFTEGDIVTYEVTVFNGSIDGATNSSFSAAETLNLHADTPPTGWHFANWTVVPEDADLGNGFDALLPETSLMMPPYAITLTAVWEPDTYTVTFDADGGEVTPASKTVTFDAAYGALPEPAAPPASRLAWLFGGWAAADGQPVTDATLVATASDHTLRAVWIEPAPLPDPEASPAFTGEAPYDGYLYRAGDAGGQAATAVEGTLALNVSSATGKLSAKAATRGGSLNFRASAWDAGGADGTQHATLTLPGGETLALSVRGNRAWGTLSGGSVDGELLVECARNRFRDRADAEAQAVLAGFKGLYTAALPPAGPSARRDAAGAEPQGAGYLSITLSTYGRVKFAGVLADGTRVSMAAQALLIDGCGGWICVPFFSPLYGRKGWAGGLVWLDPETGAAVTDRELGWLIRWDCARGDARDFSLLLDLCGGRYAKPPALAPAYRFSAEVAQVPLLYPGGAALFAEEALPLGLPVTVSGTRMAMIRGRQPEMTDGAYDYSGENCALAKLSFSASTGLYKGTFNLYYDYLSGSRPRHRKVTVRYAGILCPVRGAAFADAPAGLGHCLVPDNSTGPALKRSFMTLLDDDSISLK